jgi:hypothetical protein
LVRALGHGNILPEPLDSCKEVLPIWLGDNDNGPDVSSHLTSGPPNPLNDQERRPMRMSEPTPVTEDATATAQQLLERAADDYATGWGSTDTRVADTGSAG